MKILMHKKTLLAFLVLCSGLLAYSQQQSDSLMQYLELAAKNNPAVLQKFNEYQAALQKVPQVGSLPDPQLSLGVFLSPMELVAGNQVADIRLMQMFSWFGVLKNGKDEMSLMAKAKYESFRDAKLQVFYDVQRTWYELHKINQDIRIFEKNIELLHVIERISLVKYKTAPSGGNNSSSFNGNTSSGNSGNITSGGSNMQSMGGKTGNNSATSSNQQSSSMQSNSMGSSTGFGLADLYRIQIEIGDLDNNIAFLKDQQKTVIAKFNTFLNRPVKSPVSVTDTLKPDTLGVSLLSVSDSMLTNNPMLEMLQYEQQSLDARRKMVLRMGYPMIGLGMNYALISPSEMSVSPMNGKDMIMPMVSLTLPIYRKKYKAMKSETDYLKSSVGYGFQATANSLQIEYYEALQLYQDAERRIKLYTDQSLLARKSLDIMIKSFSASGFGLTDILRIRQQTLDYELKQVEAVVDYNTAIAWLKRLMAFSRVQ